MRQSLLNFGESAPWFVARSTNNPTYNFHSVGGCNVVLCFFESAARPDSRRILGDIWQARSQFDDENISFFGVSTDPEDESQQRVSQHLPGLRFFWDFDAAVSQQFGAVLAGGYRPHTLVLDRLLRVVAVLPFDQSPETHVSRIIQILRTLPPAQQPSPASAEAPVLVVPRVFEPEFCQQLIEYYQARGGADSGYMREKDGLTVPVVDYGHKRRRDQEITDEPLRKACLIRLKDRLNPLIHRAFQFQPTRIERHIVSCYDATAGGYFRPHRDNTTKGTAHRRFAVSLHLNSGQYEGGYLRFPEFGPSQFVAPVGGAVVFSCSLLHEATPVTKGQRFMYLPFLYDEEAAKIREQNLQFVKGA